jgi:hypothetical protein
MLTLLLPYSELLPILFFDSIPSSEQHFLSAIYEWSHGSSPLDLGYSEVHKGYNGSFSFCVREYEVEERVSHFQQCKHLVLTS